MIIPTFQCDECNQVQNGDPPVILAAHFSVYLVGLDFRRDGYHFCSFDCLYSWLEKAHTRADEMRKFCQPEQEPKGK